MNWTELETSTHQDHVIKHVLGASVLGWFVGGEAAHFLLDIGFLWTIYLDTEMNLLPQGVAITELEGDDVSSVDKTELVFDADLLMREGRAAQGLKRFSGTPVECLITAVEVFEADARRLVIIKGESLELKVEASNENAEISVSTS